MSNIEFRTAGTYYYDHSEDEGQMILPMAVDNKREVSWIHEERTDRRRLLGKRATSRLVMREDIHLPKTTFIEAAHIAELKDPDLRYALRFADAARATGWTRTHSHGQSGHFVTVTAIDNGVNSEFTSASYTGVGKGKNDTFMQNLHSANPNLK